MSILVQAHGHERVHISYVHEKSREQESAQGAILSAGISFLTIGHFSDLMFDIFKRMRVKHYFDKM